MNDQKYVQDFVGLHNLEAPPTYRLLDVMAELGELAKELLTGSDYGRRPFIPSEDWPAELGDLYFSIICLANATEVDLSAALRKTIDKYGTRLQQTGGAALEDNILTT